MSCCHENHYETTLDDGQLCSGLQQCATSTFTKFTTAAQHGVNASLMQFTYTRPSHAGV